MSWFEELSKPSQSIPERQQQSPPLPGGRWWDQLSAPEGPAIGPAEPLPSYVSEDPSRMASAGTQAVASLPTDPMARAQYFAKQRGIPIDRYFYKDDRLAYRDADGTAYFEEPKLRAPNSRENIAQYGKVLASGTGPGLPMVGGVIGGLTAIGEGPIGWGTAIPQAAAGGGVLDMVRQYFAATLTGETKPFSERAMQTGGAMMQEGVGQLLGNAGGKALSVLGRTPAYNIPETTRLRQSSERWGIPLTAAEETGNKTLLRRQKILGNTTEGEQTFQDFYNGRNEKVGQAVNTLLNNLSRQTSPRMGAQSGVEGAQAGRAAVQQEVRDVTRPRYKVAIDNNPQRFWSPDAEALFSRPSMQEAIGAAKKLAAEEGRTLTVPTFENGKRVDDEIVPDWRSWDYMKKALDGIIESNTDPATGRVSQYGKSVIATQKELMGILDKANPAYASARNTFANEVPLRDAVEKGVVGDIARLEGNDVLRAAPIIFGKGSSPEDVKLARSAFEKAGALQNWDDLARSYLQQTFNEIPESSVGSITNLGGTWRKAILGNKRKREMMEATFSHRPDFWNDMLDLMQVLDASGKAMKGESFTAFAQAGQRELAKEGSGLIPGVIETIEVWKTPSRFANYLADINTSKYAARQAELLTTPEGRNVLREIRKLGPTSAGSVFILAHFLTGAGTAQTSSTLNPRQDGPVVSSGTNATNQRR